MRGATSIISALALAACQAQVSPPPPPAPVILPDAVAIAASPPARPTSYSGDQRRLLVATRAVVAVSSTTTNPEHLVSDVTDGSPYTAWHSRTNDLVGAWIAIRVPRTASIQGIALIVGDPGLDARSWTANPRVRQVRVTRLDSHADLGTFDLDVANQELQPIMIPIDQPGGDVRITVTDVVPGTDPAATELAIAELEVIGLTSQVYDGATPTFALGSLGGKRLPAPREIDVTPLEPVESIDQFCADAAYDTWRRWDPGHDQKPAPTCGEPQTGPNLDLPAGWSATYFSPSWGWGRPSCEMFLKVRHTSYVLEDLGLTCGGVDYSWCSGLASVTQYGPWTAIITTNVPAGDAKWFTNTEDATIELRICRILPIGLACSEAISVGVLTCEGHAEGGPGADGLVVNETHTTLVPTITGNTLRLKLGERNPPHAKPDPGLTAAIGSYRLVVR